MSNTYVKDMTSGGITGHLVSFSLPLLAGNVFQQAYNMVDSIIVGRYVGANALAAVGAVGNLTFLFISLCLGLSSGIGILVSQHFGAKREDEVKTCITQAVYVSAISGIVMGILAIVLAKPVLVLMNTPKEILEDSIIYMEIVCGCAVITSLYNAVSAILRALGDSKTPLIFLVIASVVNIVLDVVFVVGLNLSVMGVAIATIISQFFALLGSISFAVRTNSYFRLQKSDFQFNREVSIKEVKMGLPLAAQMSTIAVSCVALQYVVNGFGTLAIAAYTASNRIEQLVQQPFNSLGLALSTFAGQNFGAKNQKRISSAARIGLILVAVFSIIMIFVMYAFGDDIVGVFVKEKEVIEIGAKGLRVTSCFYFMLGVIYVMRGLLNGVGDVTFSMLNGIFEVIGRFGFAILLIAVFHMDYLAAWYTNALTWTITGIMSVVRFYLGRWKKHMVLKVEG